MNEAQRKILIIFCFVLAGFLTVALLRQGYDLEWDFVEHFMAFKIYLVIILIALGLFLKKGNK